MKVNKIGLVLSIVGIVAGAFMMYSALNDIESPVLSGGMFLLIFSAIIGLNFSIKSKSQKEKRL